MQNNRNLHSSEISALYKIFKSQLPNSIILTGQDTDIISTIAKSNKKKFILINANQDINLIQDIIWNEVLKRINAK